MPNDCEGSGGAVCISTSCSSSLLTRAELSKLEAMTNPTRSPEEMKNDDFEGDVLSVFQYNTENRKKELENPEIKKSKLQEMSEKYSEELKDPMNPFHYKLRRLGYTEKEIEKFIEGARVGFEVGFIKLASQLWGIDWEFQYEQFLKRQKEIESSILDSEEKK